MVGEGRRDETENQPGGSVCAGNGSHPTDQLVASGVILAGVHRWGNGALESVACRPLLPIASRPLICHVADWLRRGGVATAVVCGNSDTLSMRRCLGNGQAVNLSLGYYEDLMPRGPAGCARDAAEWSGADACVVVEGAILPRIDLGELLETHRRTRAALTVVVAGAGPASERYDTTREPVGIYVVAPATFEHVPEKGYQDIKEALIPRLYELGERVVTYGVPSDMIPRVTGAASYLAVNMWAVQHMSAVGTQPDEFVRVGDAWVHESAEVDSSAQLVGPVLVGRESVIGPEAMIIGPTTVGAECRFETRVVVSRSAIWDRCNLGLGAIVDHSILANDICVAAENVIRHAVCVQRHKSPGAMGRRSEDATSLGTVQRLFRRWRSENNGRRI